MMKINDSVRSEVKGETSASQSKLANLKISLVVPVYNEQIELAEVLAKYIKDLKTVCGAKGHRTYEIIAVNDGSSDDSVKMLREAARLNRNLRVINFDARYGKQAAVTAGMEAAVGDCVILADVDILNPVGIIERVVEEFLDGEQIVHAYRERSGFDRIQNAWSEGFVRFASGMFGIEGQYVGRPRVALYSRNVVDIMALLPAKNKLLRSMDTWVGYRIKGIMYASGYDKNEEKAKLKQAKERFEKQGGDVVQRSKVREHTSSLLYARTFVLLTLVLIVAAIVFLAFGRLGFVYHFFLWIIIVFMGIVSVMFLARAVLIKRVGTIHSRRTLEIYNIKNIIN